MAKDVVTFLNWSSEPEHDERKRMGAQATVILTCGYIADCEPHPLLTTQFPPLYPLLPLPVFLHLSSLCAVDLVRDASWRSHIASHTSVLTSLFSRVKRFKWAGVKNRKILCEPWPADDVVLCLPTHTLRASDTPPPSH